MIEQALHIYLKQHFPKENEKCEWKAFSNLKNAVSSSAGDDIISYVSAISNMNGGHLVLGVEDNSLSILGIKNFHGYTPENLPQRLVGNCTYLRSEGLKVDEYITSDTAKTVWILHIPKHSPRQPVIAHKKAWQRIGDSLVELTGSRKDAILQELLQTVEDWSILPCSDASIIDLSDDGIQKAITNYAIKNQRLAAEIKTWDKRTFLSKAKMLTGGKPNNAAMLLLGKPESANKLKGVNAQISWVLYDKNKVEKDYQHFYPPYIIAVDEVFAKIRNLKYRYMKEDTLFPDEVDQYAPQNIREALSNCIAHMDYLTGGRITVSENEDGYLSFMNPGVFLPGSVERLISSEEPPSYNRNALLAQVMVSFNMIDSIGSGIKRMFRVQRDRYFPMPDYDLGNGKVKVTLTGKVLDLDYAKMLAQNPDLTLEEIVLLDKVQKRIMPEAHEIKNLRKKGLIEGKIPNLIISAVVAQKTGQKAAYTRKKAFDNAQYFDWILKGIVDHGSLSRKDIEELLWDRLSDLYDDKQKKIKINNLVSSLRKAKKIRNIGNDFKSKWVLVEGSN